MQPPNARLATSERPAYEPHEELRDTLLAKACLQHISFHSIWEAIPRGSQPLSAFGTSRIGNAFGPTSLVLARPRKGRYGAR